MDPGLTNYYDQNFFNTIRHYYGKANVNIAMMSIKQWYTVLLNDNVLMTPITDSAPSSPIPCRVELQSPSCDWTNTWRLCRLKGLGSELTSFLFKLLHQLLPTQERISRIGKTDSTCLLCLLDTGHQLHCFFQCPHNCIAGLGLLGWVQGLCPGLTEEDVLLLQLPSDLSPVSELAVVTVIATGLKYIWEARTIKKQIYLYQIRAEIEAKISLMRKTRWHIAGGIIESMLRN